MKRARNHERKKNRDVKFIENSDMKKLDKLMGSLESENKGKCKLKFSPKPTYSAQKRTRVRRNLHAPSDDELLNCLNNMNRQK